MTCSYYLSGDANSDLDAAQPSDMTDVSNSFDVMRMQQSCTLPSMEDDLMSNDTTGSVIAD